MTVNGTNYDDDKIIKLFVDNKIKKNQKDKNKILNAATEAASLFDELNKVKEENKSIEEKIDEKDVGHYVLETIKRYIEGCTKFDFVKKALEDYNLIAYVKELINDAKELDVKKEQETAEFEKKVSALPKCENYQAAKDAIIDKLSKWNPDEAGQPSSYEVAYRDNNNKWHVVSGEFYVETINGGVKTYDDNGGYATGSTHEHRVHITDKTS